MVRHNNQTHNIHLRKHWQNRVKTWFNQPARKRRRLEARREKMEGLFPRPLEKLRPIVSGQTVKYNKKVRMGRGFTLLELQEAKLAPQFAQSIGIMVDHRRRNKSLEQLQRNVLRLKAYVSKLVLFPRKEGKPKKGLVPDTTEQNLQQVAVQNKQKIVMGTEPYVFKKREKAVKITDAMKKEKVYKKQRIEWTNTRYFGKRQKKAESGEQEAGEGQAN